MQIAIVGFGEAGSAFVQGWGTSRADACRIYDIKLGDPATAPEIEERAAAHGVKCVATLADAVDGAELVMCTVTADQATGVARSAAGHLSPGTAWCDLNSCAPSSKQVSEQLIEAAGGRYLDVAVMEPVHPALNLVKCLISGPHAAALAPVLEALPMSLRVVEGPVGRASSIKMIRSVMVKGLEALTAECVLAAVAAGVEDEVLPSLLHGHPKLDIAARAAYNFERSLRHGARRAAEMEEVAITLSDLGLPNAMSAASVGWQRSISEAGGPIPDSDDYRVFTDLLLPHLAGLEN